MKYLTIFFLFIASFFFVHSAIGVPINSNIGLTPYKGQAIIRTQVRYAQKGDDTSDQNREIKVLSLPFVFVYGITAKSAVLVKIPYIDKNLKTASSQTRGDQGFGDISIISRYRIYTKDYKGATSRLSLLGGVKTPTGKDDASDNLGRLPQSLQIGTGSFDLIGGWAYTFQTLDYELDADFQYKYNQKALDYKFGNTIKYDFAYQKRIFPTSLPKKGMYSQWNIVLELNGIYSGRNEISGKDVVDSGGNTVFFSPGVQFADKRMIFEVSYQLPVMQDLYGRQIKTDRNLVVSLRYSF